MILLRVNRQRTWARRHDPGNGSSDAAVRRLDRLRSWLHRGRFRGLIHTSRRRDSTGSPGVSRRSTQPSRAQGSRRSQALDENSPVSVLQAERSMSPPRHCRTCSSRKHRCVRMADGARILRHRTRCVWSAACFVILAFKTCSWSRQFLFRPPIHVVRTLSSLAPEQLLSGSLRSLSVGALSILVRYDHKASVASLFLAFWRRTGDCSSYLRSPFSFRAEPGSRGATGKPREEQSLSICSGSPVSLLCWRRRKESDEGLRLGAVSANDQALPTVARAMPSPDRAARAATRCPPVHGKSGKDRGGSGGQRSRGSAPQQVTASTHQAAQETKAIVARSPAGVSPETPEDQSEAVPKCNQDRREAVPARPPEQAPGRRDRLRTFRGVVVVARGCVRAAMRAPQERQRAERYMPSPGTREHAPTSRRHVRRPAPPSAH